MPIVHSGGIRAVAMATPNNAAAPSRRTSAYAAAAPPASAIARSNGLGCVRDATSLGTVVSAPNGNWMASQVRPD